MSPQRIAYPTQTGSSASATQQPLLHPIHRLPIDVIAEIFVHCLPESVETINNWNCSPISVRKAPMLLCKVCSSWRSLALLTPRLWQTFILNLTEYNYAPRMKSLPNDIRAWLKMSGILPLTIRFRLHTYSDSLVTDSLKALFEFSSRWESILIDVRPRVPWPFVRVLPNLRGFHGSVLQMSKFPFTLAPSLKRLLVSRLPPNPTSVSIIPWNRLKLLTITMSVPPSTTRELLQSCPLLEALSICVHSSGSFFPMGSVSLIKQNILRYLCLRILGPAASITVQNISLPALKLFKLSGTLAQRRLDYYHYIFDLFTRSKCNLEALALIIRNFKSHQLLGFLQLPSCRTLKRLYIHGKNFASNSYIPVIDNYVLSQLTFSYEQYTTPLCPKLAELVLEQCYRSESSTSTDSLGRMICSRCFRRATDERLKLLYLTTRYPISTEDKEHLEVARDKRGMKLFYVYKSEKDGDAGMYFGEEGSDEEWSEDGALDFDWFSEGSDIELDEEAEDLNEEVFGEDQDEGSNEEDTGESMVENLTDTD